MNAPRYRALEFGVTRVALRDGADGVQYLTAEQPLHRLGGGLRRPGRPAGLQRIQGRPGRYDASHGARPFVAWNPGLHHRARAVQYPPAAPAAGAGTGFIGRVDSISGAAWQARRVRRTGLPHRDQRPPEWRSHPPRRRAAHGAAPIAMITLQPGGGVALCARGVPAACSADINAASNFADKLHWPAADNMKILAKKYTAHSPEARSAERRE